MRKTMLAALRVLMPLALAVPPAHAEAVPDYAAIVAAPDRSDADRVARNYASCPSR